MVSKTTLVAAAKKKKRWSHDDIVQYIWEIDVDGDTCGGVIAGGQKKIFTVTTREIGDNGTSSCSIVENDRWSNYL